MALEIASLAIVVVVLAGALSSGVAASSAGLAIKFVASPSPSWDLRLLIAKQSNRNSSLFMSFCVSVKTSIKASVVRPPPASKRDSAKYRRKHRPHSVVGRGGQTRS